MAKLKHYFRKSLGHEQWLALVFLHVCGRVVFGDDAGQCS